MGLVDYSDDSGSEEAAGHGPTMELASDTAEPIAPATSVQQQLPMLPAGFIDSYSGAVRSSNRDDPELHQGRHRITPHVAGGWPTHVYLECGFSQLGSEDGRLFYPSTDYR